jgi:hypothetical protein
MDTANEQQADPEQPTRRHRRRRPLTAKRRWQILRSYADGDRVRDIELRHGLSHTAVERVIRDIVARAIGLRRPAVPLPADLPPDDPLGAVDTSSPAVPGGAM